MEAHRGSKRQRGMTLIEITIVMIIAALVATAAVFGFQNLQRRNEIQDNVSQIVEIAADLQRKFGVNNQYGAVTTAVGVRSRTIPSQLRVPGTDTAANSYGGAITLTAATITATNDVVQLSWGNVPQSQCVDLVIATSNVARRISVAGTVVKADGAALVPATLIAQCETALRVAVLYEIGRMTVT